MAKLKEFIKDKDFSSASDRKVETFPEGKTEVDINGVDVVEMEVQFDSGPKTRYVLKFGDKEYWAGTQIMDGIKAAVEAGFNKIAITRKGQGIHTKYTVMGLQDAKLKRTLKA